MEPISAVPPPDSSPGGDHSRGSDADGELAALLKECARGDEAAFSRLYDLTSPRIFGLVLRVVRDRAQSEEVTQETFLDIWRGSARFDPRRGSPLSWMLTIAHRKSVDRVRAAESDSRRTEEYGTTNHTTAFDETSEQVERNLDRERVRRALESLTDTQRGAIELAYFGGYTHTEVATLLDLPLGTAKTRIRDGLIRLRDTLGLQS